MPALWIAPAAAGKTEYVVRRAAERAHDLQDTPRIVVPTALQARACRWRLAKYGALGVRVLTMFGLAQALLDEAGVAGQVSLAVTIVPDPVEVRLLRAVVDETPLDYYHSLRSTPGFVDALRSLCQELEAAGIAAVAFKEAVGSMRAPPRLTEMARLYAAYEARMATEQWTDAAGLVNWALRALASDATLASRWSCLLVDGFDQFAPAQIELMRLLASRVADFSITLTGDPEGERSPICFRRFVETQRKLENALGIQAQALPHRSASPTATLVHLERYLFDANAPDFEAGGDVTLFAATDEEAEVRSALRWLKSRLLDDGMRPSEVALLARDLSPYRSLIVSVAAEYELPLQVWGGLPLGENPAVSDLVSVLTLMAPQPEDDAALAFHALVDAWRSPYFAWRTAAGAGDDGPLGITALDADALDAAGRWGRVVGGWRQWQETLALLAGLTPANEGEGEMPPPQVVQGAAAAELLAKLERFVRRLTPPQGLAVRQFVRWVEEIIGDDPALQRDDRVDAPLPASLDMVSRIRDPKADPALEHRDFEALRALKDVLRGLVWAAEALTLAPVNYRSFIDDLIGAVEAARYTPAAPRGADTVLATDIIHARGLPLRAVAVLGLAEGLFPASRREDAFLRDDERQKLREVYKLPLSDSLASAEASFFYETLTRGSECLLFTRPRLAPGGASWPESPYWQEIRRLLTVQETQEEGDGPAPSEPGASWPEVMVALGRNGDAGLRRWVEAHEPLRLLEFDRSTQVFAGRYRRANTPHDGDLARLAPILSGRFGPRHPWSVSRLETYLNCPFQFFVSSVLRLEPRPEPALGMDAAQRGWLLHELLKGAYANASDPGDPAVVLSALDQVAGPLLDGAPNKLGFRPTAWWAQTRTGLLDTVSRTITALAGEGDEWRPRDYEAAFGRGSNPPLELAPEEEQGFSLRGVIDRIDVNGQGEARVIDYKSGGASRYNERSLERGENIQIPLYALAVERSLGRGRVIDGFYWSLADAKAGTLRLQPVADAAAAIAVEYAWSAVQGVRGGQFAPQPPDDGCPSFCPAAAFCWRYRA